MVITTTTVKTCYITAPAGADLTVLESALSARDVRIVAPSHWSWAQIGRPRFKSKFSERIW